MSKHIPARAAFSLIELLVVVAVIAILASMLLPTINLVRQAATTMACAANMRQIGFAMLGYAADTRRLAPAVECVIASGPDTHVWGNSRCSWDLRLADWSEGETIRVSACPGNREAATSTVQSSLSGRTWTGRRSYAVPVPNPHGVVMNNPWQEQLCVSWWDVEQHKAGSIALSQVADVSGTAMLVESWNEPVYGWNNDFGQTWGAAAFSNQDAPWYPAYGLSVRHHLRTNVLFCDGHVAAQTLSEVSGGSGSGTCPWDFGGAWTVKAGD